MEPLTKEIIGLLALVLILAICLAAAIGSVKKEQAAHLETKRLNREKREEEARQRQVDEDREMEMEAEEKQQKELLHLTIKENKNGRSKVYLEKKDTSKPKPRTLLFSPLTYESPDEAAGLATRIRDAKIVVDM